MLGLTFSEYINHPNPKLRARVNITKDDTHSSYTNINRYIRLDFYGSIYTYMLIDGLLWTTDSDGNNINRTTFRYID